MAQGAPPDEIHQALSSALEEARRLERLWGPFEGVIAIWVALGQAWQKQPPSPTEWATSGRPVLDGPRLAALSAALERGAEEGLLQVDWPDLLPRLDGQSLARLDYASAQATRAHLARWLTGFSAHTQEVEENAPLIARHGALLLAEMGTLTPQMVPLLCACLIDDQDLTRYRAMAALNCQRAASALGRETLEQMACCYRCPAASLAQADCPAVQGGVACWRETQVPQVAEAWLADTYLDWSLHEIVHDRSEWLRAWADCGDSDRVGTRILGSIHRLDDAAWPVFLELLAEGAPPVQTALLDAASWLLRLARVPEAHRAALTACLLHLLESNDAGVRKGAVEALGYAPQPAEAVMARLQTPEALQTPGVYTALARLAGRAGAAERAAIETVLRAGLPLEEAVTALVRLHAGQSSGKDFDLPALLAALRQDVGDPASLLAALLRAGTDDDGWGAHHERIVALVCEWVQRGDVARLGDLLAALETALRGDAWPPKRIALAAVAACAEVMPDALNAARPRADLEALLVESARVADSFTARRQAVNALSHLHSAAPAAVVALLAASRDVAAVQQNAMAAAGRFQHLAPDFAAEDALDPLAAALSGESAAAACVAARLLAALGSAPAAVEVAGLRQRIARMLSEALRQEGVGRDVYLLSSESEIKHEGTLGQALFDALVAVVGLPE
jgi:hypothetical protein